MKQSSFKTNLARIFVAVSSLILFASAGAFSPALRTKPVAADAVEYREPLAQQLTKQGLHYVRHDREGSQVWSDGRQNYSYVNNYWFSSKHIVTVSTMKYPSQGTTPEVTALVHRLLMSAIDMVNQSGANVQLCYVGDDVRTANVQVTYENNANPSELTGDVAGETTPLNYYVPSEPSIMHLKYYDPAYPKFTSEYIDIHEFGHSLGLGHTDGVTAQPTVMQTTGAVNGNLDYYYQALRYLYGKKTSRSIAGTGRINYNKHYGIQIWARDGKPVRYNAAEAKKYHHKTGDAKKLMGQTDWKIFANTYQQNGTTYFNLGGDQYIDARYVTIR
ncbi:M57 family metalloprotease [Lacticaseibacillus pabuli]|uniref:M57 family metalloprotease n=1 Tax=Lacticaseibacillus pabuli TaxID=3025672 RepID=A0ABY7WY69_9LACO|nr:M57 family metalloprotease [Lacticaseibacillus sp. KACC 23028]WDF82870.1 M57 family metalloprotease [Lacticaseibacillus sp. KACC 23028]